MKTTLSPEEKLAKALARVESAASPGWRRAADQAVVQCTAMYDEFTTDEVQDLIDQTGFTTHNDKALGPVMRAAARKGLIKNTRCNRSSNRASNNMRPKTIWATVKVTG